MMNPLRKRHIFELVLVLAFAFLPSTLYSLQLFISGTQHVAYTDLSASTLFAIVYQCLSLSLLYYVLHRRHETFAHLGVSFTWKDLLSGIILYVVAYLSAHMVQQVLFYLLPAAYLSHLHSANLDFIPTNFSWLFFAFILINPFNEELIVRGFLMRETFSLTKNKTASVVISVVFQTSYHLYQGLLPAIVLAVLFTIFSIFYVKTGKLLPVIIAHLIMDVTAFASLIHHR